jgi:hypothetical protein
MGREATADSSAASSGLLDVDDDVPQLGNGLEEAGAQRILVCR